MKKLITLILALLILLPAAASAVTGGSPYFGEWVAQKHGSTASYDAIIYYLNITQYKTSEFYKFCLNHGGGFGQGKVTDTEIYSDHWEIIDDHLSIPTSGITSIEVFYDKDTDTLYTKEWPVLTFARLP